MIRLLIILGAIALVIVFLVVLCCLAGLMESINDEQPE